ncbi:MAG TPA: LLM class flavin-dependent oxidoreductase [Acidimicrobiales bacterium]|nr:LLM class flavin-dependent oxidoreductase [Acidimicrobiales bacterium]
MTSNALRFGVYLPPFGPFGDPEVLVDLAVRAERAGWDGVFLWDHLVRGSMPVADPWTALGAIAQATDRILLGPSVTPLPRRRPWVVARQASTVSRLSGGRLILGVGLGVDHSGDFSRFGEGSDPAARPSMLMEGLDVLRAMWSGEPFEHDGPHYKVRLDATPPEPHPIPVWMASSSRKPAVIRRAASCDGIFPIADHTMTPGEVEDVMSALRAEGLPEERRYDVAISGQASPAWEAPNPESVELMGLAAAGATWWLESLRYVHPLEQCLQVVDAGPPR